MGKNIKLELQEEKRKIKEEISELKVKISKLNIDKYKKDNKLSWTLDDEIHLLEIELEKKEVRLKEINKLLGEENNYD